MKINNKKPGLFIRFLNEKRVFYLGLIILFLKITLHNKG